MKIPFLFLFATLLLSGCEKSNNSTSNAKDVAYTDNYLPPVFTDSSRLTKIKAVLPAVDKIFREYFNKEHFPGLAYGLVVDGQLVYSNSLGVSNVTSKTPATSKTAFRIASMTKSFTAMAILRLRDEGKLSLNDPVSKYISEVKNIKNLTKDSPAITIENLLTMSAGFPEDNPWGDRQLADPDEELLSFWRMEFLFQIHPGSNMNTAILVLVCLDEL